MTQRWIIGCCTIITACGVAAVIPGGCSGGVAADPVAIADLTDLQLDAITISTGADNPSDLEKAVSPTAAGEFEVVLYDDATDKPLYCAGPSEGMVTVRGLGGEYANLGATFIPMQGHALLTAQNADATVNRVRVEVWERDQGVCPADPQESNDDANFLEDKNNLVATETMPGKSLLANQTVSLDNGLVQLTLSTGANALVVNPSIAVPAIDNFRLSAITVGTKDPDDADALFGNVEPEIEVAIINAATGSIVACIDQDGLQAVDVVGQAYTDLNLPLAFVSGITNLPSVIRVGMVERDTSTDCTKGGIIIGTDDLIAVSHRLTPDRLGSEDIPMTDGVGLVHFTDNTP